MQTAADWHLSHKHKRGAHPKVEPAYSGNKGRAINSPHSLQRAITAEVRAKRDLLDKAIRS